MDSFTEIVNVSIGKSTVALSRHSTKWLGPLVDVSIIMFASVASGWIYHHFFLRESLDVGMFIGVGMILALVFVPAINISNSYRCVELLKAGDQIKRVCVVWLLSFPLMSAIAFTLKISELFSRGSLLVLVIVGLSLLVTSRITWSLFISRAISSGWLRGRRVAIVSAGEPEAGVEEALCAYGMRLLARYQAPVSSDDEIGANHKELDQWSSYLSQQVRASGIEEIYLSARLGDLPTIKGVLERLRRLPLPVHLMLHPETAALLASRADHFGDYVAAEVHRPPLSGVERSFKRGLDIIGAGAGLLALAPILLLVALMIRLDSTGPVMFRQSRLGFNGRAFKIYKFRSMSVMEDGRAITQATRNDSRVTRVGYWLRRSSIDELPQLLNVLRGEMSLIGPRPHAIAHDDHYARIISNYAERQHVKPGLTGWAQVHGFRGETADDESMARRVEFDLWYISHWSFWLDLKIIVLTGIEMLRPRNAY